MTDPDDYDMQAARTLLVLETLPAVAGAHDRRDQAGFARLLDDLNERAGADTVNAITGGMKIGEIPMPEHPRYWEFVAAQRERVPPSMRLPVLVDRESS